MKVFIFLILLVPAVLALDIVAETIKRSKTSDTEACDNFYRHACPLNQTSFMAQVQLDLKDRFEYLMNEPWNQYHVINDFENYDNDLEVEDLSEVFNKRCSSDEDTSILLQYFESLLTYQNGKDLQKSCGGSFCASQLKYEKNCTMATELLRQELVWHGFPQDLVSSTIIGLSNGRKNLVASYMLSSPDMESGIELVSSMLEGMKKILIGWVEKTPWVQNNNGVEMLTKIVDSLKLGSHFTEKHENFHEDLARIEQTYLTCRQDIGSEDRIDDTFCYTYAVLEKNFPFEKDYSEYVYEFGAQNGHPNLYFAHPAYLAMHEVGEMAGKIGSIGMVLAHEIGHSVIEDFGRYGFTQILIPFFSNKSHECIQNTYKKTCEIFAEKPCIYHERQYDDNGADIFGRELAYQLFRNVYGDDYDSIYEPLNVTYEQMFFYGLSTTLCERKLSYINEESYIESHSPDNIRVNVYTQLPRFRDAFQCSDDSRMVQVVEERCVVYGEGAPEVRRL